MRTTKNSGATAILITAIVFILCAGVFVYKGYWLIFDKDLPDINTLLTERSLDDNVGTHIKMKIDAVLENFAQTTETSDGKTKSTEQHYVVWLDDDSMIAVSVANKMEPEMDRVMDATWDYIDDKTDYFTDQPLELKGEIKEMEDKMREFYDESLEYMGVTPDEWEIHYYVIDCTSTASALITSILIFLGVGLVLLIVALVMKKKAREQALGMYGPEDASSWG